MIKPDDAEKWSKCKQARDTRNSYNEKRNAHKQQWVAQLTKVDELKGQIAYHENELTRIERAIRDASVSAAQCVIGGIVRRDPTECLPMIIDLRNSEADHQARLSRFKQELRQAEWRLQGMEDQIEYDERIIENAVRDMQNWGCAEIGIL